jgi:hypothetical protein
MCLSLHVLAYFETFINVLTHPLNFRDLVFHHLKSSSRNMMAPSIASAQEVYSQDATSPLAYCAMLCRRNIPSKGCVQSKAGVELAMQGRVATRLVAARLV